jgi:hypothetical protein
MGPVDPMGLMGLMDPKGLMGLMGLMDPMGPKGLFQLHPWDRQGHLRYL